MELNQEFWNQRYIDKNTGWDLGKSSPPLVAIFDSIENKKAAILIPGCGNAYEAEYLLKTGFTNVTLLDISPALVKAIEAKFKNAKGIRVMCEDFFDHQGQYDYIIEQTFFCALNPLLREQYVLKMHSLLKPSGWLTGVMFNRSFEKEGPPFGGTIEEYEELLSPFFDASFKESKCSIDARQEVLLKAKLK